MGRSHCLVFELARSFAKFFDEVSDARYEKLFFWTRMLVESDTTRIRCTFDHLVPLRHTDFGRMRFAVAVLVVFVILALIQFM